MFSLVRDLRTEYKEKAVTIACHAHRAALQHRFNKITNRRKFFLLPTNYVFKALFWGKWTEKSGYIIFFICPLHYIEEKENLGF